MSFQSSVERRGGTVVKAWDQQIYMKKLHSKVGVCRTLSLAWIRFKKANDTSGFYNLDPEVVEEIEWLNHINKGKMAFVGHKVYNYSTEESFALLEAYTSMHELVSVKPYIAQTSHDFFPRGFMNVAEGIQTATVGFGYYGLLEIDPPRGGSGHAVATLVNPGGSAYFFDPEFGEARFPDPFNLRSFLYYWLPRHYPSMTQATVERYY
jgi:hypothetical protein